MCKASIHYHQACDTTVYGTVYGFTVRYGSTVKSTVSASFGPSTISDRIGTVGNWVKYRIFRDKTVLIGNITVQNVTMLGESTVQDRTSRGNKVKCHELFKNNVIKFLGGRRGQRLSLEMAPQDGPTGHWSNHTDVLSKLTPHLLLYK